MPQIHLFPSPMRNLIRLKRSRTKSHGFHKANLPPLLFIALPYFAPVGCVYNFFHFVLSRIPYFKVSACPAVPFQSIHIFPISQLWEPTLLTYLMHDYELIQWFLQFLLLIKPLKLYLGSFLKHFYFIFGLQLHPKVLQNILRSDAEVLCHIVQICQNCIFFLIWQSKCFHFVSIKGVLVHLDQW
jgi:hypothetical protein